MPHEVYRHARVLINFLFERENHHHGRQHLWLKPGERGDGLPRRRPAPGRYPRRAGNPLLDSMEQIPQGTEVGDASPVIKTRSLGLKKATWPGVWPGVGMHSQSGSPGTPASRFNACRRLDDACLASIRPLRRGVRHINRLINQRPIGSPYSGRYFPAASGSSSGCTYTGRSQLRASSSAEPE